MLKVVPLKSFVGACVQLSCRDAVTFLKAAACSVVVVEEDEGVMGKTKYVKLLGQDARATHSKKLAKAFGMGKDDGPSGSSSPVRPSSCAHSPKLDKSATSTSAPAGGGNNPNNPNPRKVRVCDARSEIRGARRAKRRSAVNAPTTRFARR